MVTLAIWGEVAPNVAYGEIWWTLSRVQNIGDCRLRGVGVVAGASLPSPIDLTCRPYNTRHTTV